LKKIAPTILYGLKATLARAVKNVTPPNASFAALGAEFTPAQATIAFLMKTEFLASARRDLQLRTHRVSSVDTLERRAPFV